MGIIAISKRICGSIVIARGSSFSSLRLFAFMAIVQTFVYKLRRIVQEEEAEEDDSRG